MGEELRSSGIDLVGDCAWGTHFCIFYQTKEDLVEILVPYFRAGLENNEFCMWVTSQPLDVEEAIDALRREVPNLDSYLKRGQIEILDYTQWYVLDGVFDADHVMQGWIERLARAREKGFLGLRLSGNTFWLIRETWRAFRDYEALIDSTIGHHPMIALCTYSLEKCGASEIVDVVANHQFALARQSGRWEQIESTQRQRALDLQRLNRYLVQAQEKERQVLARELHDEAGQALTALKIGLGLAQRDAECAPSVADRLEELKQLADGMMEGLRRLAVNLRPGSLDRLGLAPAVQQYIALFRQQTGLNVQLAVTGLEEQRLSPEIETNLYRMVQECLTNVARHAHATRAGVMLARQDSAISLVIEDDGVGFDIDEAMRRGRLGLVGLRERAEMMGGTLTVETAPGRGATVFTAIPLSYA